MRLFLGKTVIVLYSPSAPAMCSPSSSPFSASASADEPIHPIVTGCGMRSTTVKSRTLYSGESIAACSAHPRATDSSAFMVVDSSLPPKALEQNSLTQGTREAPPIISTKSICSIPMPAAAAAALAPSRTAETLSIMGLHISRKTSRVIVEPKSSSSIRHSTESCASMFAERIFLVFVTASSSLKEAFLLLRGSQPTFFLNCAANSRMRHSFIVLPPTLSAFSQMTVSLPRMNCTTDTENMLCPMLQNATVHGFSASKSFER
mmetsp:Transcript_37516/g.86616  ORF Transcript_37516/g.86616 Transcript_37516/m.86616 type:complete len:262 (-) Transcript_37516:595-1380(-)